MKNGKTLTLYMTPRSFLTGLWRNLFNEPRDYEDSKMLFDLHRKGEHWAWESSDGIRISKRKEYLSRVYYLSLRLGKYFHKLKLKVKEHLWILQRFMESLFGVLELVCVILIYVLLLLLLAIASLVAMCRQVLSRGLRMFLQSRVRRGLSLGKTRR